MFVTLKVRTIVTASMAILLALSAVYTGVIFFRSPDYIPVLSEDSSYIKWVDFKISSSLMSKTINLDIKSQSEAKKLNFIELLAYLAAKYGGNFSRYKEKDLNGIVERLKSGEKMNDITKEMKYYSYFLEAYTAIFKEFVGTYRIEVKNKDTGQKEWQTKYGLKVFSPIAKGYGFSHYKDFGDSRSYGYRRRHLGNDLMGNIGTPIIAVESGIVEVAAWNVYGGWRIGIRSFDSKRYYYYAHLRKDRPFVEDMYEGKVIQAGDVIGYLGMTGYSTKENVNNIRKPHLHFGLQLIFDESQKDGVNQIWIDVYDIIELLQKNRSEVVKDSETKDFVRAYDYRDPLAQYYID